VKKKKKEEMFIELEGQVNIVTKVNGRVVEREPLDGDVVLRVLLHYVSQAVDRALVEDLDKNLPPNCS